jgi:hypothetical protein
VALPEPLVVMKVEKVEAVPTVAVWAAEGAAHSSSGLVLASGMLVRRMLVATAHGQAALRMLSWVRPHLGTTGLSGCVAVVVGACNA